MIHIALVVLLGGSSAVRSADGPVGHLEAARDLLLTREFAKLTALVDAKRAAARDAVTYRRLAWTLNAFALDYIAIPGLIDEWARADPLSAAPLTARAINRSRQARLARGGKWASETTAEQFSKMAELEAAMAADCRVVLARDPGMCPCHRLLVLMKSEGSAPNVVDRAFKSCPLDPGVNIEYLNGLTPRWGGSYARMRGAIEQARRRGLPPSEVRTLEAFIAIDEASLRELDDDLPGAVAILNRAVADGPTAQLLEERARMLRRLKADPARILADADDALTRSQGGLLLSPTGLAQVLVARASALDALGRKEEAREDIGAAIAVLPGDSQAIEWAKYLGVPIDPFAGLPRASTLSTPKR